MRIGVGGRAFGVRGGISNKGFGVGVGPISAGTSWKPLRGSRVASRGGSSGGGGAALIGFAAIALLLFLVVAWPYLLGTYLAVAFGAPNPSTARSVVGWLFEILWIGGVIVGIVVLLTRLAARERERDRQYAEMAAAQEREEAIRHAEEARRHAEVVASGVVYAARHGNSTVYRHGACTINHRSADVAERCRRKAPGFIPSNKRSQNTSTAEPSTRCGQPCPQCGRPCGRLSARHDGAHACWQFHEWKTPPITA